MDMDVFHTLPPRPSSAEPFLPGTDQGGGGGTGRQCHAEAPRCGGRPCAPTTPPHKSVGFGKPISTSCCAADAATAAATPPRPHADSNGKMGPHLPNGHHPHLSSRIGPRLRAEGLMVPPASDAATLRRQVAALQIDLEAHVDGQQRLQSINQQLRERLELYMKQNHENVERAEAELNTLHEDMEQTLELQRRLAQRATSLEKEKKEMEQLLQKRTHEFDVERSQLQAHIAHISEELREHLSSQDHAETLKAELTDTAAVRKKLEEELHNFSSETEYLKTKADEYSNELRCLFEKEQRDKQIETLGCKCLLRRNWLRLKDCSADVRSDKEKEATADAFYKAYCCKRGFQAYKIAAERMRRMRSAQRRQHEGLLRDCLCHWSLAATVQKRHKEVQGRQDQRTLKHAFQSWTEFAKGDQLMKKNLDVAVQHRRLFVLKHLFETWRAFTELERKHNEDKIETVKAHIVKLVYKQVLGAWKYAIRLARVAHIKFKRACVQENRWCLIRSFHSWLEALKVIKYRRAQDEKGWQFRKSRQWRAVIKSWRSFVKAKRSVRLAKALAFRHYLHTLRIKGLRGWKESVTLAKMERRATAEVNQALMRAAMVFWQDHHLHFAIKKKKESKALIHKMRQERKVAKGLLIFWWEVMAARRRAVQLEHLFASRRQRRLLSYALHCWMHGTFDDLLQANAKFQLELKEAQNEVEDQKQLASSIDVENLQLIDRLHTMSAEIAHLKMNLNEKIKQEEDLQRALEDSAVLESSLRGELEEYQQRVEDKKVELQQLQKKMNTKHMEDAAAEVHHALEIRTLEQALEEKNAQLAEKANQIETYKKSLKDSIERLEGASDENQDKLQSAFEIAASLRKLLDDREQQFATLEGNCRRRELELGEVQRKLAVANCTLCETVEARDARIQELENMLLNKQNEVQDTLQQCSDLELALDAKETRIRKLEYEMKLLTDRESFKTKSFYTGITSWGGANDQPEVNGTSSSTATQGTQLKECMRNTYCQTMPPQHDSLMQGPESSHRTTSMGTTSSGSSHSSRAQELHKSCPTEDRASPTHGGHPPHNLSNVGDDLDGIQGISDDDDPLERPTIYDSGPHSLYYSAHDPTQSDWETSFALVSTSRPATSDPFVMSESRPSRGAESARTSSDADFRMALEDDPGAVDSLHMEIQRLQARIMNRLRDSSSGLEPTRSSRGLPSHQREHG